MHLFELDAPHLLTLVYLMWVWCTFQLQVRRHLLFESNATRRPRQRKAEAVDAVSESAGERGESKRGGARALFHQFSLDFSLYFYLGALTDRSSSPEGKNNDLPPPPRVVTPQKKVAKVDHF